MIVPAGRAPRSVAGLLLALAGAASAQDNPSAGKNLFENTASASGTATLRSCTACHFNVQNRRDAIDLGGDLDFDLVLGAFLNAIATQTLMGQFNAGLSPQQKRDIAAYIADVPKARPNQVDFSVTSTNVESTPLTIAFSNAVTATSSLTLGAVGLSGNNPTDFLIKTVGTTCANNLLLAAGASCTASVAFRASTASNKTASLNFPYMQGTSVNRTAQLNGTVSSQPPPQSASGGGGALGLAALALIGALAAIAPRRRRQRSA